MLCGKMVLTTGTRLGQYEIRELIGKVGMGEVYRAHDAIRAALPETNYDISLDGQRFLIIKEGERIQQSATQLNVVQNWFEELKRRVPAAK